MLFGSNKIVGIDIGTSSIKLVELEVTKKSAELVNFGFIPTPATSIVGGEIANPDMLADAIRQLVQQTNTKAKKACVGIWGSAVITKKISMPRIDEKLVAEQLKWEAEQYIPFDVNETNLEYQIIRNSTTASPEQMNVLLIAAKRDLILRYAEAIEASGLTCQIVDVSGFALANCFEANYGVQQGQVVMLLNMGAGMTNFVVVENGEVTFSRDLPVGGLTYTNDIQKALGISIDEAESLKISAGTGQAVPQEVSDILSQTNEVVTEEIRRSYDFFLATNADVTVSKVYVTGGGLGLPGLAEQLQNSLGVGLEILNPFNRIKVNGKKFNSEFTAQIAPYASVGIGLAMRSASEK